MWAADNGHSEMTKMLLDAEANPNAKNSKDKTALDIAKEKGHAEVARILEEAAAK